MRRGGRESWCNTWPSLSDFRYRRYWIERIFWLDVDLSYQSSAAMLGSAIQRQGGESIGRLRIKNLTRCFESHTI